MLSKISGLLSAIAGSNRTANRFKVLRRIQNFAFFEKNENFNFLLKFSFWLIFDVFGGFMASGVFFLISGGRTLLDYTNFHQNPTDLVKNHYFSMILSDFDDFHTFSLIKSSSWWSKHAFWSYRIIIWWSEIITMVPCCRPTRPSSWSTRHSSWPRTHSSWPTSHFSWPTRHSCWPMVSTWCRHDIDMSTVRIYLRLPTGSRREIGANARTEASMVYLR